MITDSTLGRCRLGQRLLPVLVSLLLATAFFVRLTGATSAFALPRVRAGWVEPVVIYPGAIPLRAKLDTGADNSSLSARNIERFERKGKPWVRFEVANGLKSATKLELPVFGTVKIKRHGRASRKRSVVKLQICLDDRLIETTVNLDDRSKFEYPLLLGRSLMAGEVVVDPAAILQTVPNCTAPK